MDSSKSNTTDDRQTACLSKDALLKEYSPSQCSHRLSSSMSADDIIMDYVEQLTKATSQARSSLCNDLGVKVSDTSSVDIFWPDGGRDSIEKPSSVFVYVHGGNWEAMGTEHSGHMASTLCAKGAVVVLVGYTVAPKGTLSQMVDEVQAALVYTARRFPCARIVTCGFSAGGHLLAQALASADWKETFGVNPSSFYGVILLSGLLDLTRVQQTYINDYLKLTVEEAQRLSPLHCVSSLKQFFPAGNPTKVLIAFAEFDSSEYHRMSSSYRDALHAQHGLEVAFEVLSGMDHFQLDLSLQRTEGSRLWTLMEPLMFSASAGNRL